MSGKLLGDWYCLNGFTLVSLLKAILVLSWGTYWVSSDTQTLPTSWTFLIYSLRLVICSWDGCCDFCFVPSSQESSPGDCALGLVTFQEAVLCRFWPELSHKYACSLWSTGDTHLPHCYLYKYFLNTQLILQLASSAGRSDTSLLSSKLRAI